MPRSPLLTLIVGFALAGNTLGANLAIVTSAPASPITAPTKAAPAMLASGATAAETGQATAAPAEVKIVEPPFRPPTTWKYEPAVLTVKLGTKVTWTNTGAVLHTATADDGKTFDSRNISPKAAFTFVPSSAGSFAYHCTYHPWMKGTIVVQP